MITPNLPINMMPNTLQLIAASKGRLRDQFEHMCDILEWDRTPNEQAGYQDKLINNTWIAFVQAMLFQKAAND